MLVRTALLAGSECSTKTPLDPLDFDKKCDGSLPLESMISFNPQHRKLFEDIDKTKYRVWGLTNAYKPVGRT
jgi:hypothetical protein